MIGFIMIIGTQTTMAATTKKATVTVDTSKYVTTSNFERLVDKYGPEVKKFINANTQTVKEGYKEVYVVYVKEEINEGYGSLFSTIITLILALVSFLVASWMNNIDNDILEVVFIVLGVVIGIIFVISAFYFVFQGYYQIVNPQYYAIHDMIDSTVKIIHAFK